VPKGLTVLTKETLAEIRRLLEKPYYGINSKLAKQFGVSEKTIRKIRNGEYKV
jgi:DNA-binding XRE family transcriptional regulator